MEQRCHLSMVWMTWVGLPLFAVVVGLRAGVLTALAVLGIGVLGQWLYVRWFPRLSTSMGYGSVADVSSPVPPTATPARRVTLYTANVCPFCPIIRKRLSELQKQMAFELEEVDVTFRPEIVLARKIRSVPVLEAGGRLLVGNATSAQIAEFLVGCR